jgi:uncharacterized membrane protein YeiH
MPFAADRAGALRFGVEDAAAAIRGNMDLLGGMVLAFATAFGGGIVRDVLISDVPTVGLRDSRYVRVAFSRAAIVFFSTFHELPPFPWRFPVLGPRNRKHSPAGARSMMQPGEVSL